MRVHLQAGELLLLRQRLLHQDALDALLHGVLLSLQTGNVTSLLGHMTPLLGHMTPEVAGNTPSPPRYLLQRLLLVGGQRGQPQLGGALSVLHDESSASLSEPPTHQQRW